MKTLIMAGFINLLSFGCFAQSWTDWADVGGGIEVAFKYPDTSCQGYTFARMRNSSSQTYSKVRVSFDTNCTGSAAISSYNIKPGEVNESRGNWYTTDGNVSNIELTTLTDMKYNSLLPK